MRRWFGLQLVLFCGAAAVAHAAEPAPALSGLKLAPQDSFGALLNEAQPDAAPVTWRSTQVRLTPRSHLRVSVANSVSGPGATEAQAARLAADARSYEVTFVRDWPRAVWVALGGAKGVTRGVSAPGKGACGGAPGGVKIRFGNVSDGQVVGMQLNVCWITPFSTRVA